MKNLTILCMLVVSSFAFSQQVEEKPKTAVAKENPQSHGVKLKEAKKLEVLPTEEAKPAKQKTSKKPGEVVPIRKEKIKD